MPAQAMNLQFLTNPTQRVATGKRLPTAELETLLLYGSPAVRLKVLNKAAPNAHVLAANPNTYHLMEGLVHVSDPAYLAELIFAIRRQISALAQSRHGNVMIQEVLRKVPAVVKNDLAVSLIEQAYPISCGEFGNRVIQVLFDDPTCAKKLYPALMPHFTGLITSEYGQMVVAHTLSTSDDDEDKCPFWTPIINSTRSLMTSLWNDNRQQVIGQIIKRVSDPARCSGSDDRLWRLVNKVLVEELVLGELLNGYLPTNTSDDKKDTTKKNNKTKKEKSDKQKEIDKLLELDDEEEEEDDEGNNNNQDKDEGKMTRAERDEFIATRSTIINSLISCGVEKWRNEIVEKLLAIHEFHLVEQKQQEQNSKENNNTNKKNNTNKNKNKTEDAAEKSAEDQQQQPLLLDWTQKQSLCSVVECILRQVAAATTTSSSASSTSTTTTFKKQLLAVFGPKEFSIVDNIGHRYAAIVARELVKHGDFYLGAQNIKLVSSLVGDAAALVKQSVYSSFFQALAQSSKKYADELTTMLLKGDGKAFKQQQQEDKEKKAAADAADAAAAAAAEEGENKDGDDDKKKKKGGNKKTRSSSSKKRNNNNEDAAAENNDDNQDEQDDIDGDDSSNNKNGPLSLAEAAIDHPSASYLLQLLVSLDPNQQQISADKHSALVNVVYTRVSVHPIAFSRLATSPHGTHVIQALIKAASLDDKQIKAIAQLCPKARVQGKFFGTSALARNKYSCHVMIALLQQMKARKDALVASTEGTENKKSEDMMEHIRLIMNDLKPHVHFLALSASSGRKVFETMCQIGSDKLRRMMCDVVAMKCEAYLKGDPYIEGDREHESGNNGQKNKMKAHSGSAHPFKAKHDAKRRQRSESSGNHERKKNMQKTN